MPTDDQTPPLPSPDTLRLVLYPDPLLKKRAKPVGSFDSDMPQKLKAIGERMLEMMRQHEGVGLAGPQAGLAIRMFVMNATGKAGDDRIYINPKLSEVEGDAEDEEGCLSLPEIRTPVIRATRVQMDALDVEGNAISEVGEDFVARVWQHEVDHLDGILITDKMPPTAKMASRKQMKLLEADYQKKTAAGARRV